MKLQNDIAIFTMPKEEKLDITSNVGLKNRMAWKAISYFDLLKQEILPDRNVYIFGLRLPMDEMRKDMLYNSFFADVMKSCPHYLVYKPYDFCKEFSCKIERRSLKRIK